MLEDLTKLSIKELRSRAQSTAPEAGREPYIGHTIRFFSIYITKIFLHTPITPLAVTILSVILFLIGILLFAFNIYWLQFIGIAVIYVSILLDGTNGELARLQKYRPDIGSFYVEPISHDIQYGLMFVPFTIGAYLATGSLYVVYAGFAATVAKLLQRFFIMRYDQVLYSERKHIDTEGEFTIPFNPNVSLLHKLYRWVNRNMLSSASFIIPLLFFSLIERIDLFIWFFAVAYSSITLLHFTKQLWHIIKIDKPIIGK